MSLIAGRQISGSVTSASYATTASYALSIETGNGITGSLQGTASWANNVVTASAILGGKAPHIPYFITDTTLATSSLYQSGSTSVIINQDNNTTANPEALYVWQSHPTSINVVSGKGNLNNYLQLNIQNTNQGANASSDIVATANNGSENDNYIDLGINSQNFSGFLGGPNDSYLYTHGHNFWIGNINDGYNFYIFNSSSLSPIITLTSDGRLILNGNTQLTGSLNVSNGITGSLRGTASFANNSTSASYSLTASYASNVPVTASYALNASNANTATSSSYASNASTADNATYATTAGNGGVTQIIAGAGISLIPTSGQGAVTVIASGGGGVTIISGSNTTSSFTNSNTWTFNHNLGTRTPIISVFDSNYNQIIPQNIVLTNTSSATITFPTAESGFAIASLGGATGTVLSSSYSLFSTYADTASYYSETDPVFVAKSASLATTGSNIFKGNQTISGSLIITGSNTLIGTKTITGSLYVTGSQILIGNQTLIGTKTITGSVFISGSKTVIGTNTITGSLNVTGSQNFIGSQTVIGNQVVTGSLFTSGSQVLIGNTILSGSIAVSGSQTFNGVSIFYGNHTLSGSNTITGNTSLSGSLEVSGSSNFHNSLFIVTGSTYIKGITSISGSTGITGSLNVIGDINVVSGSSFTRWGNKLFNYGQFSDTTTQTGSANTAYSMKFNTTDFALGVSMVSGSRITVENTGIYNLQFSAQIGNTANTAIDYDIWFAYTGSNISNSNTQNTITKAPGTIGRQVAAWNIAIPISASDYIEIKWSSNASTCELQSNPTQSAPSRPAIPSVIATLTQIA